MFINYKRTTELANLINAGVNEEGLYVSGQWNASGAPTNTADVYIGGAVLQNTADATVYYNAGTTAAPNFQLLTGGGGGGNGIYGGSGAVPGSTVSTLTDTYRMVFNNATYNQQINFDPNGTLGPTPGVSLFHEAVASGSQATIAVADGTLFGIGDAIARVGIEDSTGNNSAGIIAGFPGGNSFMQGFALADGANSASFQFEAEAVNGDSPIRFRSIQTGTGQPSIQFNSQQGPLGGTPVVEMTVTDSAGNEIDLKLQPTEVTIGNGAAGTDYFLPIVRGTNGQTFITDGAGNVSWQDPAVVAVAQTYTPTNVSTDRSYDADATTTEELADVLGTLIADLQTSGIIS